MSLDELRKRIDALDGEIVKLIGERLKVAEKIGAEKKSCGRQINDRAREQAVLNRLKVLAQAEGVSPETIERIYDEIITLSRRVQATEVAFQGVAGSYSEEAIFSFFGREVTTRPCENLEAVFESVTRDETEFGIIPVENSLEGSISRSYDLLLDSSLMVSGEIELRISHSLIANPEVSLDMVKRVYSHPQALGQSRSFLTHLGVEAIATYDTAGSVKMLKEQNIQDGAAIASARAAEIYGMKVLARSIEDNPHNFTRFFILSRQDSPPTGNDKTSIVFSVKHRPRALYDFIREFAERDINLTKIESRPTRHKPWEYNFYLDFEGHREDEAARNLLAKLEREALFLKILGSYPKAKPVREVNR